MNKKRYESEEYHSPNGLGDSLDHLSVDEIGKGFLSIACLVDEAIVFWNDNVPPIESHYSIVANRNRFIWNEFLVPAGQLLYAANKRGAFSSNTRINSFFTRWSKKGVISRQFGQIGNGFYPVAGDNWTCAEMADEFVRFYSAKRIGSLFLPEDTVGRAMQMRDVFRLMAIEFSGFNRH